MIQKRQLTAQQAIEWAFQKEKAQLELPTTDPSHMQGQGFGVENVVLEVIKLGTRVDTSKGRSYPHHDADIIAAIVGGHPVRRLAISLEECGRLGVPPDWMPGEEPKMYPKEWKGQGASHKAKTAEGDVWRTRVITRPYRDKRRTKTVWKVHQSDMCPVITIPHPDTIKSARLEYLNWWKALDMVRTHLQATDMLSTITVTDGMPPKKPCVLFDQKRQKAS